MRVLIVCINYAPEVIGTGLYTTGMAEYLASKNVDTDVVTARPYYPAWRTFEGWRKPWWTSRTSDQGVRITHCPIYVPKTPTGLHRILHYISFAMTSLPVLIWKGLTQRPDIILLVAPSIVNAPGVWLATRLGGAKSWLHIQDYEVEAAFATGLLTEQSRLGRAAKAFELWCLKRFDRISSISDPMLENLHVKGVAEDRIVKFQNWANLAKISPVAKPSPLKHELGITTELVALYSGNIANKQGLEVLIEMAQHLLHRDNLSIVICGDGPFRERLETLAANIPMIRFFPLQPIERLSDLLGMADVHLLPQIAGAADLVLPSKLANMLASGRPIIATTEPDTALGREVQGVGQVVPPGDAKALASALEVLLDDPQKTAALGEAARSRALERWDVETVLGQLKSEFEGFATWHR